LIHKIFQLKQWYYLFAPGRIAIQEEEWKKLDFLNILETTANSDSNQLNSKKQAQVAKFEAKKKIEFTKIFEEKSK
jgi:hypothetical protein